MRNYEIVRVHKPLKRHLFRANSPAIDHVGSVRLVDGGRNFTLEGSTGTPIYLSYCTSRDTINIDLIVERLV